MSRTALFLYLGCSFVIHCLNAGRTKDFEGLSFRRTYLSSLPHNASSCANCHEEPTIGGSSRVTVIRIGHRVQSMVLSTPASILHTENNKSENGRDLEALRSARVALTLLGDGLVEVVSDSDFIELSQRELAESHRKIHGQVVKVPVLESQYESRVGRFGWKAQHATILSAVADALRNELGVPNTLYSANFVPESLQNEEELNSLVEFIRTRTPTDRDQQLSGTTAAQRGSASFDRIGCAICHVRQMRTAPPGTKISGSYSVPIELGNKLFHPFSDFLLHDVGTGDGIVQAETPEYADQSTANKFRTAPLWGLRFRTWLMHDGQSVTYHQAIMRHAGEAADVVKNYERLSPVEKHELREFLNSL